MKVRNKLNHDQRKRKSRRVVRDDKIGCLRYVSLRYGSLRYVSLRYGSSRYGSCLIGILP